MWKRACSDIARKVRAFVWVLLYYNSGYCITIRAIVFKYEWLLI